MKFTYTRKVLHEGLKTVGRAIPNRSAWPILNHILISSEEDGLRLTAFDLELGMECRIPAKIEEPGTLTVPGKLAIEMLANLPDADVSISSGDRDAVKLQCQTSDYQIESLPAEEFRPLPDIEDGAGFEIQGSALREMIRQTLFSISPDAARPIMCGILLELHPEEIRMVSTDTHRMSFRKAAVSTSGEASCVVPSRALGEVSRLLDDEEAVQVTVGEKQIRFIIGTVTVISRLVDGQYPDYQKVIPKESSGQLTMPAVDLLARVRRASIIAGSDAYRLTCRAQGSTLIIDAKSGDIGTAHEEMPIEKEGEDLEIILNADYLHDFLSAVGECGVTLQHSGGARPGVWQIADRDDYIHILMPMMVMK